MTCDLIVSDLTTISSFSDFFLSEPGLVDFTSPTCIENTISSMHTVFVLVIACVAIENLAYL